MKLTSDQSALLSTFALNEDISIYENYSGRGMYGRKCFGFSLNQYDSPSKVAMKLAVFLADNDEKELAERLAENVNQDSVGLGSILYFPNFEWCDEEYEDEESEEDEEVEE